MEKRLSPRQSNVLFEFFCEDGGALRLTADDASAQAARFPSEHAAGIRAAHGGSFVLDGVLMDIKKKRVGDDPSRTRSVILRYEAAPSFSFALTEHEQLFLSLEMSHMWDRYKQLQEKNKYITNTVFRLYMVLFIFAAAPFTLQRFTSTGISRVWGFGGVWLALAVWFFCDRSFRAYGTHWFEKTFCLRQIDQIRKITVGLSERYNHYSLFPTAPARGRKEVREHTHISRSQVKFTVYFYKFVSLFQPFYLTLFASLILFPDEMSDPNSTVTRTLFLRVMLGFSFIFFAWLMLSMDRCFGILKNTFRARRISKHRPQMKFPRETDINLPGAGFFRTSRDLLRVFAIVVSVCNLIRFFYLMQNVQPSFGYWWTTLDWHLLSATVFIFVSTYAHDEAYVRSFLKAAKRKFPLPDDEAVQNPLPDGSPNG
ncbi:MAG: hypothetical protein LC795_09505 [Acidobacteria bacterium]|nr:hypothetical protein [Acidobacteriota bacterium]